MSRERILSLTEDSTPDISRYFIVKKFYDGWLMRSQDDPNYSTFIPRWKLVKMGYESPHPKRDSTRHTSTPAKPITIPLSKHPRRKSWSCSEPDNYPKEEIIIPSIDMEWSSDYSSTSCPDQDVNFIDQVPSYFQQDNKDYSRASDKDANSIDQVPSYFQQDNKGYSRNPDNDRKGYSRNPDSKFHNRTPSDDTKIFQFSD